MVLGDSNISDLSVFGMLRKYYTSWPVKSQFFLKNCSDKGTQPGAVIGSICVKFCPFLIKLHWHFSLCDGFGMARNNPQGVYLLVQKVKGQFGVYN